MEQFRNPSESETEQSIVVTYEHINGAGRLFGGRLSEWIDVIGGITARRHCKDNVTTASMDIDFFEPAFINNIITLKGKVIYTGNTSLLVRVNVFTEENGKNISQIACAYLVFVAVDENGKPVPAVKIRPQTEKETADYKEGEKRMRIKKEIRQKSGKV